MGREEEVEEMTKNLSTEWELLLERIRDKTQRLREANQQQQFNQVSVARDSATCKPLPSLCLFLNPVRE